MEIKLEYLIKVLEPYQDCPVFDEGDMLVVFDSVYTMKSSKSKINEEWRWYSFAYWVTTPIEHFEVEIAYDQVGDYEWSREIKTSAKYVDLRTLAKAISCVVDCHEKFMEK